MKSFIPVSQPFFSGKEKVYLNESIDSGWVSSEGPFVKRFEKEFSSYIGMPYGVAVSSGSAALDIAIELLDIRPGDEIILPTFTIISPLFSILRSGGIPVFVDSDSQTWNLDTDLIESKISPRTKALLVVHTYGLPVNMDPIMDLAKKYNLLILEDSAEAHGLKYKGRLCGSFGDISIFSFYANKNINTGEGGMIMVRDEILFKRAEKLRNLSFDPEKPRFVHSEMGWNYRFTNLQAALGLAQLENLEKTLKKKLSIGEFYQNRLGFLKEKGFTLPLKSTSYSENHYWVFGLVCPGENEKLDLIELLNSKKIGHRPFFWCMHEQPILKNTAILVKERYPVAEKLARLGIYIPSGPGISEEELEFISVILEEKYG